MLPTIAGAILAGGENTRMGGRNKAFLEVDGVPIIERTLRLFGAIFDEIIIVTNDPDAYAEYTGRSRIVTDIFKGRGPLGGIHAGLTHSSKEGVFFVACDMPRLHIGLIERLLAEAASDEWECVVPVSAHGPEPLHAVYNRRCLPILEYVLRRGDCSVRALLKRCRCRYIHAREEEYVSFVNINTPEDQVSTSLAERNERKRQVRT